MATSPDAQQNLIPPKGIDVFYWMVRNVLKWTEFDGMSEKEITNTMRKLVTVYSFCKDEFSKISRRDLSRYFEHLRWVAKITLRELPNPSFKKILVALLHDIFEDTEVNFTTIQEIVGKEVAIAVDLLTKKSFSYYVSEFKDKPEFASFLKDNPGFIELSAEEQNAYYEEHKKELKSLKEFAYYSRLFDSGNDLAISVKIADRLHNLRDLLGATSLEKIQEYIQETKKYIIPWLEKFWEKYRIGIDSLNIIIKNLEIYLATSTVRGQMELVM